MSIAEVVQEGNGTPPNPVLLELQERAREMVKYYGKGMGALLVGIKGDAENVLDSPTLAKTKKTRAYEFLEIIEDFYSKIPKVLPTHPDYAPLEVVRRLLPRFRTSIDFFYRSPTKEYFNKINALAQTIMYVGGVYRESITNLLNQINTFPNSGEFKVHLVDIHGMDWGMIKTLHTMG